MELDNLNLDLRFCNIVCGSLYFVIWIFSVEKRGESYKEMQPPHHHSWINLDELKAQLVKKLGPEGSKQYFHYLQRFLSLKLGKAEFNKLCLRVLGRENIPLHNLLIRSILRNACCAKPQPPTSRNDDISKHVAHIGGQEAPPNGFQHNGSHISLTLSSGLSNGGDILPVSSRKARSGFHDRRSGDRRSALGSNEKTSFAPRVVLENGDLNPPDIGRPVQRAEDESENLVSDPVKMPVMRRSPDCPPLVYKNDLTELVVRNNRYDASCRSPLLAPLGVPLCSVSIGGARRALPPESSSRFIGTFNDGTLLDSHTLRDRVEYIAVSQGLEGVSVDCANLLNHGLDSYMKGIIRSCIELVGARSEHELIKNNADKHHGPIKLINGVKPGHLHQRQEQKTLPPISLQDFRVAMELNPRQLGEDWPLLLERISTHAFEE